MFTFSGISFRLSTSLSALTSSPFPHATLASKRTCYFNSRVPQTTTSLFFFFMFKQWKASLDDIIHSDSELYTTETEQCFTLISLFSSLFPNSRLITSRANKPRIWIKKNEVWRERYELDWRYRWWPRGHSGCNIITKRYQSGDSVYLRCRQ